MKNHEQMVSEDIVLQPYKGANPVAVALGEGALHTKFLAITGLVVGGIATFLFHEQVTPRITKFNEALEVARKSESLLKSGAGGLGHWFMEIPKGIVSWIRKIPSVNTWMNGSEKAKDVIEGAITVSTGAGILGSLTGGTSGIMTARAAQKQDADQKTEINHLRGELLETKQQLEDAKTVAKAHTGELKVAPDAPPPIEANPTGVTEVTSLERKAATVGHAEQLAAKHAHASEQALA